MRQVSVAIKSGEYQMKVAKFYMILLKSFSAV